MAYVIRYNYGSFSFENFSYYALALLVSIIHAPPINGLSKRYILMNITSGDQAKAAIALDAVFNHYLEPNSHDEMVMRAMQEMRMRRAVKMQYMRIADRPVSIDEYLISLIKDAIQDFKAVSVFPSSSCDFTELYRLIHDLGNFKISLPHEAPSLIKPQLELFANSWPQAIKSMPPLILFVPKPKVKLEPSVMISVPNPGISNHYFVGPPVKPQEVLAEFGGLKIRPKG